MEKLALALVVASRKLRPYFHSHTIEVLTNYPLKQVLQKPDSSGRLLKWAIELGQFEINFRPRTAIKGQAVADFIAEFALSKDEKDRPSSSNTDLPKWKLYTDGSSNVSGAGAGIVLESPEAHKIHCALRFGFKASNNEAEYEALIAGLRLAKKLKVKSVEIFSDS